MRRSDTLPKDMSYLKSGDVIPTVWFDDLASEVNLREPPLLVITREKDLRFDIFCDTIRAANPRHVVPPYSPTDQTYTSAAAERVRSQGNLSSIVGVMLCGTGDAEELDFLAWAHGQNYSPIIIPPDRRPRCWQINQMFTHGALGAGWYHLAGGDRNLDVSKFPGIWTFGEDLSP